MGSISLHEKPRDLPGVQLLDQCGMDSYPWFSQSLVGFDFDGFMKFHFCASSFCRSRHVCAKCESCFKIVILVGFLIPTWSLVCRMSDLVWIFELASCCLAVGLMGKKTFKQKNTKVSFSFTLATFPFFPYILWVCLCLLMGRRWWDFIF